MASKQIPMTPSSVNTYIKTILEGDVQLRKLYIGGEASNVKYHSNGTIYFNIKDADAQINCVMFKNYQKEMTFKLKEGDKVEILGNIYTYVKMGQISINVFKIRKMGQGDLFQKYLELKNNLEKLGYFSVENKKAIPKFPNEIGVITSDTGAAIRDIITTIKRRAPYVKIKIIPTLVQGNNAYQDIIRSIEFAQNYNFDVLIVGRGGGSIEDLWAFNEEEVAKSIFNCKIPIISAVGHETDFTIADFVADVRAATPTAAGEIATPNIVELQKNLTKNLKVINNNIENKIMLNKQRLNNITNNQYFINPLLNISNDFIFLQEKFLNLTTTFQKDLQNKKSSLKTMNNTNLINIQKIKNSHKLQLEHQKENLDNLNPLTILSKGYSTVKKEDKYIKSIKEINKGDDIIISFSDGEVMSKIFDIKENNDEK